MTADRQQSRVSAAAVFCGSCLLFLIQPLLGRTLLPLFGGSAAVWTICLAAYQLLLLAGYAYAHGIAHRRRSAQRTVHLSLLCMASAWAVAFAALRPALRTVAGNTEQPALEVLLCVLACAGLPYVALAAGSTVVQGWLAARAPGGGGDEGANASTGSTASVYRLYAVSNLGSFAGLLVYPFVLEPFVSLSVQWWAVALGLCGYTGLMACLGRFVRDGDSGGTVAAEEVGADDLAVRRSVRVWTWYVLPGATSFLLNAIVAHLFTDVTPLPMVWVAMLSAFLLSYVVGFSSWRWLTSSVGIILAAVSLCAAAVVQSRWGDGSFLPNATAGLGVLFFGGSVLHGWLYEERPETVRLSRYYLAIAAGGAAGGLLASLVAPRVFTCVTEYPLALTLCALLLALRLPWPQRLRRLNTVRPVFACVVPHQAGPVRCHVAAYGIEHALSGTQLLRIVRVTQTLELFGQAGALPVHYLWCGQTTHGLQVRSPLFAGRGTSYYGATGGGIAFSSHPVYREGRGVKVGVVGLGAGCLASYGRPQDLFRFYEINPLMIQVAGAPRYFSFLNDAPMRIDLVPGDARKMLEREQAAGDPRYDILMIDAYSGDAVPYHLATLEAFQLYFERLEEDGILAMHVSNWHVDLLPLCKAVAQALGVHPYGVVGVAENSVTTDAMWVFMTRHPHRYLFPGQASAREVAWERVRDISVPADEKGSLLPLLRY